jgi:hypothetical protein
VSDTSKYNEYAQFRTDGVCAAEERDYTKEYLQAYLGVWC